MKAIRANHSADKLDDNQHELTEPLLHANKKVMRECGCGSVTTWWRWRRDRIVPDPDREINGRLYYTNKGRAAAHSATIGLSSK